MKKLLLLTLTAFCLMIIQVNAQDWNEVIKIVASDSTTGDNFGKSVSIDGDYAIVGAHNEGEMGGYQSNYGAGAAYLLKRVDGDWSEVQKIVAGDGEGGDNFGVSVSISGNYAIIGAPLENHGGTEFDPIYDNGAAYVFENQGGTWNQVHKLVASDENSNGSPVNFGSSVAISGAHIIVGAPNKHLEGNDPLLSVGAVYMFETNGNFINKILVSDPNTLGYDNFGHSVAISGNYAIVGVPRKNHYDPFRDDVGAAYILKRENNVWSEVQKIVDSDEVSHDNFGHSVSIDGDYAIVGVPGDDYDANDNHGGQFWISSGAAVVFENIGGTWTLAQKIVACDRDQSDYFGSSVSISGDNAIIGAPGEDDDDQGNNCQWNNYVEGAGSGYVFENISGTWIQEQKIYASDRSYSNGFGHSVAISGTYAIVGVPNHGCVTPPFGFGCGEGAGGSYLFGTPPPPDPPDITPKDRYTISDNNNADHKKGDKEQEIEIQAFDEATMGTEISLYPNPNQGRFVIELGATYKALKVEVTDVTGKLISSKQIKEANMVPMEINQPAGAYLITISTADKKVVIKVLKE